MNEARLAKLTDAGKEFHILVTILQKKITTNTTSALRLIGMTYIPNTSH